MNKDSLDAFEQWWETEVNRYADELELPLRYVEEEFIIEGELIKVRKPETCDS